MPSPRLIRSLALLWLAALAGAAAAADKPARKGAAAAPKLTELELAHGLDGARSAGLARLVERFNAENADIRLRVAARDWRSGEPPALLLLYGEDEDRYLDGKPRYRPLWRVMRDARVALPGVRAPAQMSGAALESSGRLRALPVGLATPVMYINREAFSRVGLDPESPPKTWFELQQALGKLYGAGVACPYTTSWPRWVHVENTSAWHNEAFAQRAGKAERLSINGMLPVKHLAMMNSWVKSRYMHVFGRADEGDARFASGECAVLTSDSAAYPQLKQAARFDIGVAALPYHEDFRGAPQNTLADGANLWFAEGRSKAEYAAMARFARFLMAPQTQVELQRDLGALPLTSAGVLAAGSALLAQELPNVRVAMSQLTYKPVTKVSARSRIADSPTVQRIIDEELEALWADRKPAKQAVDDAVARAREACAKLC